MVLNDSTKKERNKQTFVEHPRALYYPEICAPLLVGSLTWTSGDSRSLSSPVHPMWSISPCANVSIGLWPRYTRVFALLTAWQFFIHSLGLLLCSNLSTASSFTEDLIRSWVTVFDYIFTVILTANWTSLYISRSAQFVFCSSLTMGLLSCIPWLIAMGSLTVHAIFHSLRLLWR